MPTPIEKTRGAIAKVLAADIIATPENPLSDIEALQKVMFVMKNGKVFRQDKKKIRQTMEEYNMKGVMRKKMAPRVGLEPTT
jgi:hypothetical protein